MSFFTRDKKKVIVDEHDEEIEQLKARIKELRTEKQKLVEELEETKFKKRLEQEEIVHLQRINEERLKQEVENEKIKLTKKYQEDISRFKEEQRKQLIESLEKFHTKIESRFNEELKNLKELYGLLMKALPNVNLDLTRHEGSPKFIEAPVEYTTIKCRQWEPLV